MSRCRYLIDENTSPSPADQLKRIQPEIIVQIIGDKEALPKGTSDPEILCWLEQEGFSLITRNRKIDASASEDTSGIRSSCASHIYHQSQFFNEGCY